MSFPNLPKTFRYVNEMGEEIIFEWKYGFLIEKPKGIDTLSIRHSEAQGINQVGSTFQSSNVQSRPVTVSGRIVGAFQDQMKTRLLSVVRPDLSAKLYADDYYLDVRPSATPTIEGREHNANFQFSVLAAYPYWQKDSSATATLSGVRKSFKFPWNISGGAKVYNDSGSVVSFNATESTPLVGVVAGINAVQSGSGDPSPSNVRPISGWSAVNVYREAQYDAGATPSVTVDLGGTRYGGTLDVKTGVLTVTKVFKEFNGTESISHSGSGDTRYLLYGVDNEITQTIITGDIICSHLPTAVINSSNTAVGCHVYFSSNARANRITFRLPSDLGITTGSQCKTWLSTQYNNGTPFCVCYGLYTPQTVQLTAEQVNTLVGQNVIWADTGDVSVRYKKNAGTPYRFGEVVTAAFINVYNEGQVPVPFTVTLSAIDTVVDPKLIEADTNEYLLLNKTLVAGEKVVIQITHDRTYVNSNIDGECRGALDLGSSFFRLKVGDNVIKPEATSGKANLNVEIDFAAEIVGIAL